jgi:hypothetical protein
MFSVITQKQVREALAQAEERRYLQEKTELLVTAPDYGEYVALGLEIREQQ